MAATVLRTKGDLSADAVYYGALDTIDFDTFALAINQTNATVQTSYPLGINYKIVAVACNLTGAVAGTCSFNLVSGTGAENGVAPGDNRQLGIAPPSVAANGNQLFAADTALTMSANVCQVFYPQSPQYDAIFGAGTLLTVRVVTNGAAAGSLKVVAYCVSVDRFYQLPNAFNPFVPSASML